MEFNVCEYESILDLMGTVLLERLCPLGSLPEVPGLVHMISLLHSDICWCHVGKTTD